MPPAGEDPAPAPVYAHESHLAAELEAASHVRQVMPPADRDETASTLPAEPSIPQESDADIAQIGKGSG